MIFSIPWEAAALLPKPSRKGLVLIMSIATLEGLEESS